MGFFNIKWFAIISIVCGGLALLLSYIVRPEDRLIIGIAYFAIVGLYLYITLTKLQLIEIDFKNYYDKKNKKLKKTLKNNKDKLIKNVYLTGRGQFLGYKGHIIFNKKYFIMTKKRGIIFVNKDLVTATQMFNGGDKILIINGDSVWKHKTGINPVIHSELTKTDFMEGDNIKALEILEDWRSSDMNTTKGVKEVGTKTNLFLVTEQERNKKKPR